MLCVTMGQSYVNEVGSLKDTLMVVRTGLGRTQRRGRRGTGLGDKSHQSEQWKGTLRENKDQPDCQRRREIPFFLSSKRRAQHSFKFAPLFLLPWFSHLYHLKKWTPKPQVYHLVESSISKNQGNYLSRVVNNAQPGSQVPLGDLS